MMKGTEVVFKDMLWADNTKLHIVDLDVVGEPELTFKCENSEFDTSECVSLTIEQAKEAHEFIGKWLEHYNKQGA